MKTNQTSRRGFTLVELLVVIVIIASLAGLTAPMVIRQRKKADQTEAISNARQVGLALFEFETEFGSYPDAGTVDSGDLPTDVYSTYTSPPASSNDAFLQLFGANITKSEEMFYAKIDGIIKPDGDIADGKVLENGECGFAYIMDGPTDALSTGGNPSRILVATPMLTANTFDKDPFDSKAVLLRIDNSASTARINDTGTAQIKGKDVMDAATEFWGTGASATDVNPLLPDPAS